jgi:hypothetical protein
VEAEGAAIAPDGEAHPALRRLHVVRCLDRPLAVDLGGEPLDQVGVVLAGEQVGEVAGGELPDVLALVQPGVAHHHQGHVGPPGRGRRRLGVGPVVDQQPHLGDGDPQAVHHRGHLGGPHVARSTVPQVDGGGQRADHGQGRAVGRGQGEER